MLLNNFSNTENDIQEVTFKKILNMSSFYLEISSVGISVLLASYEMLHYLHIAGSSVSYCQTAWACWSWRMKGALFLTVALRTHPLTVWWHLSTLGSPPGMQRMVRMGVEDSFLGVDWVRASAAFTTHRVLCIPPPPEQACGCSEHCCLHECLHTPQIV